MIGSPSLASNLQQETSNINHQRPNTPPVSTPPPTNACPSLTPVQALAVLLGRVADDPALGERAIKLRSALDAGSATQAPIVQLASQGLLWNAAHSRALNALAGIELPIASYCPTVNPQQQHMQHNVNAQSSEKSYNSTSTRTSDHSPASAMECCVMAKASSVQQNSSNHYDTTEANHEQGTPAQSDEGRHQPVQVVPGTNNTPYVTNCGVTIAFLKKRPKLPVYPCDTCGKTFKLIERLKTHRDKHLYPDLYACKQCGAKFSCERKLRSHQVKHTVLKPSLPAGLVLLGV
ncbi:hypothetical protein SeLEV6574_g07049 [Synchytrium endobioticum]|uniref:C2H2-type domain-containing protein n=1 Tax=Synchytrium endobioticum TaxID=286115 RepID=A0A507CJ03_9FUNG|nr:hypothetical protein SeLEV6574_g07049 [Synchytrium endobioticum]